MTATRREQAVQLRLAGLSRSQIAEALGLAAGGGEPLTTWLRDVPAPAWTRRPRAKDDLRATAVGMRKEGRSYREIREVVGVSKRCRSGCEIFRSPRTSSGLSRFVGPNRRPLATQRTVLSLPDVGPTYGRRRVSRSPN
jgi:hypothetical protein